MPHSSMESSPQLSPNQAKRDRLAGLAVHSTTRDTYWPTVILAFTAPSVNQTSRS